LRTVENGVGSSQKKNSTKKGLILKSHFTNSFHDVFDLFREIALMAAKLNERFPFNQVFFNITSEENNEMSKQIPHQNHWFIIL